MRMRVIPRASAALLLVIATAVGCESKSRAKIYILKRPVKAGEVFDQSVVDEVTFSDATGYYDVRKDFDFVTRSTLARYEGQQFTRDLQQFTPVTTDVLAPPAP